MSLFHRKPETRALDVPFNVGPAAYAATPDGALSLVPVFAANRLLADTISTLPIDAYRRNGEQRQPISTPQLLQHPAAFGTTSEWVYAAVTSLATHGNAFGLVTGRDGYGYPVGLEWLNPARVSVDEHRVTAPRYFVDGKPVPAEDIVHIRWFVQPGRVLGLSPIDALRSAVEVGLGAQAYRRDWFANGGVPPGVFKHTSKTVDQGEADAVKARLVAAVRKHQPIVHGADWSYESIQLPADSAEFVATMRLTANQVAAAYGLPPTKLGGEPGGSLTYSTTEQESLDFIHALRPWLTRIEEHISALLPDRAFIKFSTDALVSTDLQTRMAAYAVQRQIGLRSVDELRALEDLPPLPNGQGALYLPTPSAQPATAAPEAPAPRSLHAAS